MKDPKIEYKRDSGKDYFIEIEAGNLSKSINGDMFLDCSEEEIIDTLNFNFRKKSFNGVFLKDLPNDFQNLSGDFKFYSPEYVKWLESKYEELCQL